MYAEATSGSGGIGDGTGNDIVVNGETSSSGSSSVEDPANVSNTGRTTTSISFSWDKNGNSDDVMLVYKTTNDIGTPVDGNSYSVSQAIPGGGTVLYNGGDQTSYTHSGLTQNTTYYYKIFSVDAENTYSSGVGGSVATLKETPSNHASAFTVSSVGYDRMTLTWSDNDGTYAADAFLVVLETASSFSPTDGNSYTDDTYDQNSDGKWYYNINHGTQTATFTGLDDGTTYYAKIWPISNTGGSSTIYDYKTDGTVPNLSQATQSLPTLPLVEDFDYEIGSLLVNNGWQAHSGAGTASIDVTNGLSFAGYASSGIGGAANVDNTGEDVNLAFQGQTSGTIYAAFIIKAGSSNSAGYFLNLGQSTIGTTFFSKVWINATGNGVGIGNNTPNPYVAITADTPTLLVVKYTIATKLSELFVFNTFPDCEPETADASFTETATPSNVGSIALRQYDAAQRVIVDGIRIATTWHQAVAPVAAASASNTIGTGDNINQSFSGTNVALSFGNVSNGSSVTVSKYSSGPSNVSFSGSAPTYVSGYRWVIDAGGLAFSGGTLKIAVSGLTGIGDPNTVDIYKRTTPGSGAFEKLTTTYADGYLSASISSFSEFILGSSDGDNSLPVSLTSFTATAPSGTVVLTWKTESETENLGFIIQRKLRVASSELRVAEWDEIASYATYDALTGQGSTSEAHEYAYTDAEVVPGATYVYRLGDVDYGGKVKWHTEVEVKVEVEEVPVPLVFGLKPAYPNPFNPSVTIPYGLTEDGQMTLKVYNLRGALVEELISTYALKGTYSLNWQPQNLSAGIYIVRMQSGNHTSIQKVVFVK